MKRSLAVMLPLLFATASFAGDDAVVRWKTIVGVITSSAAPNKVGNINPGGGPWTVSEGRAVVNLDSGYAAFFVEGLVLLGSNFSGTPGPVNAVKGTLVCDAGQADEADINTSVVPLDAEGNAEFKGSLESTPPSPCTNPVFLIRTAGGAWIATGAVRFTRP